jgi:hypothetical protein
MNDWQRNNDVMTIPTIRLESLRKTTKNISKIAGIRADIWTRDLPNTKQES